MKIVVFAPSRFTPPILVQRVATERATSEQELRLAGLRLSGGVFAIVILTSESEQVALHVAHSIYPNAKVILVRGGAAIYDVLGPGSYRRRTHLPS